MVTVAPAIAAPLGSVIRPATLSAGVGYLHLTGRQIIMSRNLNVPTLTAAEAAAIGDPNLGRPDPRFANNGQFESIGRSQYDGMTISLNGQRGLWGTVRLSYTFSKALDDAGNAFFSTPQDNFDVEDDWGRSDNDQRHRLVLSGTAPPFTGVQFAYLFSYASAPPFSVQTGNDRNNDTNATIVRSVSAATRARGSMSHHWTCASAGAFPSAVRIASRSSSTRSTCSTARTS